MLQTPKTSLHPTWYRVDFVKIVRVVPEPHGYGQSEAEFHFGCSMYLPFPPSVGQKYVSSEWLWSATVEEVLISIIGERISDGSTFIIKAAAPTEVETYYDLNGVHSIIMERTAECWEWEYWKDLKGINALFTDDILTQSEHNADTLLKDSQLQEFSAIVRGFQWSSKFRKERITTWMPFFLDLNCTQMFIRAQQLWESFTEAEKLSINEKTRDKYLAYEAASRVKKLPSKFLKRMLRALKKP